MTTSELRIDNWINTPRGFYLVQDITTCGVGLKPGCIEEFDEKEISGVPLTPDILEKCGFKDELPWKYKNLALDSEGRLSVIDQTGYGIIIARQVKYLHQLQNLFFALVGEELKIEL